MNRTTLVLLPGMDGTGTLFEPFIEAMGSEFAVKVVRYPGDVALGYPALEDLARAQLPREGPFVILGESFSGPIAVSLAASCASQLKGLVFSCSFVRNPRPAAAILKPIIPALPVRALPIRLMSYALLGRHATAALSSALAYAIEQVSAATFRARLRAIMSVDATAALSTLECPILYLQATEDRLVPPSAAGLIAQINIRTRISELDAPHFLLQAAPKEAARIVGAFMREVQNAA